jgi:hypothetical protein
MPNSITFSTFFDRVKASIADGTFAKLTLAKTIGNTDLMNIYMRSIMDEEELKFTLTFKFQQEEVVETHTLDEAIAVMIPYINKPFLSALLFTTEADVTMKLNKKRVANIIEQAPTFKHADPVLVALYTKP